MPLRAAIADYAHRVRGLRCRPEQVLVVNGSQQALYLSGQVLLTPNDVVWREDPGYPGARAAFAAAGAKIIPVPVDDEGLVVNRYAVQIGKVATSLARALRGVAATPRSRRRRAELRRIGVVAVTQMVLVR